MWSFLTNTVALNREAFGSQKGGVEQGGHPLLERYDNFSWALFRSQ
jgi:hypothetical protein